MLAQHHAEFSLSWREKSGDGPVVTGWAAHPLQCGAKLDDVPGKCHRASIHKLHVAT